MAKVNTEILYSVVVFKERDTKLFECIPDCWFVDRNKCSCYWPPKNNRSFRLRAFNKEKPDLSWRVHKCYFVSGGHGKCHQIALVGKMCLEKTWHPFLATYNNGLAAAKQKAEQKFDTSSAEDHLEEINFRRRHPVLALSMSDNNFDHLFGENLTPKSPYVAVAVVGDDASVQLPARKDIRLKETVEKAVSLDDSNSANIAPQLQLAGNCLSPTLSHHSNSPEESQAKISQRTVENPQTLKKTAQIIAKKSGKESAAFQSTSVYRALIKTTHSCSMSRESFRIIFKKQISIKSQFIS